MYYFTDTELFGIEVESLDSSLPVRRMTRIIVLDNAGRIGLVESKWPPHLYELPGGGCEEEESFDECAIRECREEMGLEIDDLQQVAVSERSSVHLHGLHLHIIYYTAHLVSIGVPTTTDPREQERAIVWLIPDSCKILMREYVDQAPNIDHQRSPAALVYVLDRL